MTGYKQPIAIIVVTLFSLTVMSTVPNFDMEHGGKGDVTLDPRPAREDIYFLGNSMFGTGLDMDLASSRLENSRLQFAYYDGHYTSMWYLGAELGFPAEDQPDMVVWGFRPTYGILPAFRQNRLTAQAEFEQHAPPRYAELLAQVGSQSLTSTASVEAYTETPGGRSDPFEWLGRILANKLASFFAVIANRDSIKIEAENRAASLVRSAFTSMYDLDLVEEDGEPKKASDLLISFTTGGEIQRADALVVDAGERFLQGSELEFELGFVPLTIRAFEQAGIDQIVVIFKPRGQFTGSISSSAIQFERDAVAYMDENDIPYLNLMADVDLTEDYFAHGDHYTQRGREYVTNAVVDRYLEVLAQQAQ